MLLRAITGIYCCDNHKNTKHTVWAKFIISYCYRHGHMQLRLRFKLIIMKEHMPLAYWLGLVFQKLIGFIRFTVRSSGSLNMVKGPPCLKDVVRNFLSSHLTAVNFWMTTVFNEANQIYCKMFAKSCDRTIRERKKNSLYVIFTVHF
jgi:hypothetical protein